jgi:hypothetical protein
MLRGIQLSTSSAHKKNDQVLLNIGRFLILP